MDIRKLKDYNSRRKFLENQLHIHLSDVGSTFVDNEETVHCENLIGSITLPLGVAGPLQIKGSNKKDIMIPLATTEGALVASVSRGCKIIEENHGVYIQIEELGTTRGPVFQTTGIEEGNKAAEWIKENLIVLKREAETTSSHINLIKADTAVNGTELYVRFYYDTDEAMGMNMVTIATEKIVQHIEKELPIVCLAVAGNFDIDKKPAWLNFIQGRGRRGWAEVILSPESVKQILKTSPEQIVEIVRSKCWEGSMMSGSLGFNAHFANIVAAFFAATGQDLAHIVEGSHGITSARILPNGQLYFSIMMPALMVGIVGGGTKLKTQTEARSLTKANSSLELVEVLLGAVLAGELSLIAAISSHSLAQAHKTLGR